MCFEVAFFIQLIPNFMSRPNISIEKRMFANLQRYQKKNAQK